MSGASNGFYHEQHNQQNHWDPLTRNPFWAFPTIIFAQNGLQYGCHLIWALHKIEYFMKTIFLFLSLLYVTACSTIYTSKESVYYEKPDLSKDQVQNWALMVGAWYASQPSIDGGTRQIVSERFSDGTYKYRFKFTDSSGKVKESTEVGQWGVAGDIYFSIYRGKLTENGVKYSDPSDPYNYDAYQIIELSKSQFVYKSITNGSVFTAVRVESDFVIPDVF